MRDPICLHARLAVSDGLTHQPIHPLSPATADTAVAAWETCAHRAADLPPGRRSDMSPTTHDSLARGHRVREFVCTYRTLRDDQGQAVRLPTQALSDPRIAAATLAPLLASETVEVFAVACLSTRHQSPRLARALPRHALEHAHLASGRVRARVPHTGHHRAARRAQPPERRSHTEPGRCATHASVGAGGRHPRHAAARSPDRRRRRPLLQLPRSRNAHRADRGRSPRMTPRRAITPPDCRASLRAVKPLRFAPTPFGAGGLDGPSGPPRIGNYVMAGMHPTTATHSTATERREPCTPRRSRPASR